MTHISRAIALMALLPLVASAEPPKPKFKLGKDTTFVTAPLDADGYVDYEAALNDRLRGKTTADTNAAVLLGQAIGPKPNGKEMPADFYTRLGTKPPPEKGAYFVDLDAFFRELDRPDKPDDVYQASLPLRSRPWTAKEQPDYAAWLTRNEPALALAAEAAGRPAYYFPHVVPVENGQKGFLIGYSLAGVQSVRGFADALVKRAMLRVGEGKPDAAWADLQTAHRLGRHVAGGGSLIELLVGIAVDSMAYQGDLAFLAAVRPDAKQAAAYAKDLRQLPPLPSVAERISITERFTCLDAVQKQRKLGYAGLQALAGGRNPKEKEPSEEEKALRQKALEALDWETILRTCNTWYDRLEKELQRPASLERRAGLKQVENDLRKLRQGWGDLADLRAVIEGGDATKVSTVVSEKMGVVLVGLLLPAADRVTAAADRCEQQQRQLQIAFALQAYRADQGKYPAQLADLSPTYLPSVPADVFTGKSVVYKPADGGYVLYSVGENGKDDRGAGADDDPKGDDLPVRMK